MSNSQLSGAGGDGATSPYADLHKNLLISIPSKLLKLKLDLKGPSRELYTRDQSPFTNLQNCINAQTQLQDVYFVFKAFPVKWTSDAFTSLANSCSRTLRYLELGGCPGPCTGTLDLKMLSVCESLEVLHLLSWDTICMTYRNVEKLPTSLKRLILHAGEDGLVQVEDPNVFKRLVALEWLSLFGTHFSSAPKYGNQQAKLQFYRTMMQGLLSLRKLQGFDLIVRDVGLNRDRSTVKMLQNFDDYDHNRLPPNSRHPQREVCFNLGWRWYFLDSADWSDRPFDKYAVAKLEQFTGLGQTVEEMDGNEARGNANEVDQDADKQEDLEGMNEEDGK